MDFVWAILGIGFLIFVHELGHFLAAKRVGVHVETFALGFQPTIFGFKARFCAFKWGETEYVIGMIPFGGYVKMAGEEPGDEKTGAEGEFASKRPRDRALVLVAGALMNLVFGFIFFILAYSVGVPELTTQIGSVSPGTPAWKAGLRPGDRVTAVDGKAVEEFTDLFVEVALSSADEALRLTIDRPGIESFDVEVTPEFQPEMGLLGIGIVAASRLEVGSVQPHSPAEAAGLHVGDRIDELTLVAVGTELTLPAALPDSARFAQLLDHLSRHQDGLVRLRVIDEEGATRELELEPAPAASKPELADKLIRRTGIEVRRRIVGAVRPGSRAAEVFTENAEIIAADGVPIEIFDAWSIAENTHSATVALTTAAGDHITMARQDLLDALVLQDIQVRHALPAEDDPAADLPGPLVVGRVPAGSPAAGAGVRPGDRILSVDGKPIDTFGEFAGAVTRQGPPEAGEAPLRISVRRGEDQLALSVTPQIYQGFVGFSPRDDRVVRKAGILDACVLGTSRTVAWVQRVILTLRSLARRELSARNLSGPVGIIMAIRTSSSAGLGRYLFFLALLSVNLGVFNLLPFPILDGGHLVFLAIEKIKGSPVPDAVLHYTHLVAFVLLIGLALFVTYHDVLRWIIPR